MNQTSIVAGIVVLLLAVGSVEHSPEPVDLREPSVADDGGEGLPTPKTSVASAGFAVGAAKGLGSSLKAPAAPVDERPEVRMYAPASCWICETILGEIEKAGGEMPFRLVRYPLMDWMNEGPWFYWKSDESSTNWVRIPPSRLGTLNGKRLDFLLQEWLKTQPESRKTVSRGQNGVTVCCCRGTDTAACLCLEEIRRGIKRGPCTCNARFGSRHYMKDGSPVGPAGGYRELGKAKQTPMVRIQAGYSYCPNCRRR